MLLLACAALRPARPGRAAATVLVLGLLLLGAAAAEAQTPRTLVSNAFQTGDDSANTSGNDHAQLFHTGNHTNGYTLTSVVVNSDDVEDDDFDVEICEEDGTANEFPSTTASDCTALTAPASFVGIGNVTFRHTGLALSANTNYVVVITQRGTGSVEIDSTTSSGEDSQGLSDWSIKNKFYWNDSGTWKNKSGSNEALSIIVFGYENVVAVTFTCSADSMVNRIWTGNLTVGTRTLLGQTAYGWNAGGNYPNAALTDTEFTFGGDTYKLTEIRVEGGQFAVVFASDGLGDIATQATRDSLVLHVDSDSFDLSAGSFVNNAMRWSTNLPTWADNDGVCLALTEVVVPPDVTSVEFTSTPPPTPPTPSVAWSRRR